MMMAMSTGSRLLWVTTCVTCCIAAPPSRAAESIIRAALPFRGIAAAAAANGDAPGFSFVNVAREAGLNHLGVFGGATANKYLLETTGTGVAFIDVDNDGWLDLFFVNGTTLEGFPGAEAPTNHLYRNKGDGRFEDITERAGVGASGWGQGACVGDFDGDGYDDLFVSYYGGNRLYRNRGNGTF